MKPGQRFWGTQYTHGGWLRASPGLKSMLVEAGLPRTAPESRHGSSNGRAAVMLGGGLGFALAVGALLLYRRRR
jgi:hypothetical protein